MFKLCILVIGLVGAYDNCLNVIFEDSLLDLEQNQVGRWLLRQGLHVFVEVKAVMTLLVVAVCFRLEKTRYRVAIPFVAVVQMSLLLYLTFASHAGTEPKDLETSPSQHFVAMQCNYWGAEK